MKPEHLALLNHCGLCLFREDFDLSAWRSRTITAEMKSAYEASSRRVTVENGVATLPISGPIIKDAWTECGEVDPMALARDASRLANDPSIKAVVVRVDSPGGTVSGTQSAADAISALAAKKKTVGLIDDGGAYSAAYWIIAQTSKIFMTPTSGAGSIGVRTVLVDTSKMYADEGVVAHYITTGKYKAVGAPARPVTDDDIAYVQAEVNTLFNAFVDAVAKGRGLGKKAIRDMEARCYTGQAAMDAGLVDVIMPAGDVYRMIEKGLAKTTPQVFNSRSVAALALARLW